MQLHSKFAASPRERPHHEHRGIQILALVVGSAAIGITAANLIGKAVAAGQMGLNEWTTTCLHTR